MKEKNGRRASFRMLNVNVCVRERSHAVAILFLGFAINVPETIQYINNGAYTYYNVHQTKVRVDKMN